jgi:ubiquinone/menaquinone biosynthesis C-methylase UbiE
VKTLSRFDEAAQQWDNNPTRVELAGAVGAAIQQTIPIKPHWRALDYGAGTGLLSLNLQPHVASLMALDSSTGMLEKLGQKISACGIKNVEPRLWNLEVEPFPETGFDLVVSSMTLHHLRDVPLVLKRLAAVIRPGGWLAAADLETEDGTFHGDADGVFHHGFAREQMLGWLGEAGFAQVQLKSAHTISKPDSTGELRKYGVFLAIARGNPI